MIRVPNGLMSKDKKYYVAVSMGMDSLAALMWMKNEGFNIEAIHVNHSLRPQNDEMENAFVYFCNSHGILACTGLMRCNPTESDCRDKRLEFFREAIDRNGTIITAHHLNDWVESYLMNCLRGNPERRPFEVETKFGGFSILHPFLLTRKSDFLQYIDRNGLRKFVVEDETNLVIKGSRRNWVRNELINSLKTQDISLEKYAKRSINSLYEEYIDDLKNNVIEVN
jgi:tRNA(Ile)-lysidine synthase